MDSRTAIVFAFFVLGLAPVPFSGHGLAVTVSAEDVVWVNELETSLDLIGKEIVLEGRYQGRLANLDQILLKNCKPEKIEFRLGPNADRRFPSNMSFIRLTGTLTKSEGKLVMHVKSWMKINTSDVNRYADIAQQLGPKDHRRWYQLADRTQRLAEFYGDDRLHALAGEARANGLRAEEAALQPTQVDELLKLAERAKETGLTEHEARRMRHKALRWLFDGLKQGNPPVAQYAELADKVFKMLPGAQAPLASSDVVAVGQYRKKPVEYYEANLRSRDACDRELWLEVKSQLLLTGSELPGADAARLADEAKQQAPDRPELWRQLLRKWAEAEAARVTSIPPASHVRKVASTFQNELGEPERARVVLRQWLDARRSKLTRADADGRVRLARDYRSDLKDDAMAAKLLLEAVEIETDLPEAVEQLKSLGYVKEPTGWVQRMNPSDAPESAPGGTPLNRLPRAGMIPGQVKEILGEPNPGDIVRIAAGRKDGKRLVLEQWTFRGPPDLIVTFQVMSATESRVIAMKTQTRK